MIAAALALLAVLVVLTAAARVPALGRPAGLCVLSAAAAAVLAAAALCARAAGPPQGAGLVAAYVLTVAAAAVSADVPVRTVFAVALVRRSPAAPADEPDRPGPLRGGLTIGVLERIAVCVTILAGWPEGIAVVLAVKGLARYPELRENDASEQFIIGTFTSVLWSLAVAGTGMLLLL